MKQAEPSSQGSDSTKVEMLHPLPFDPHGTNHVGNPAEALRQQGQLTDSQAALGLFRPRRLDAGDRQVKDVKRGLAQNMGGSGGSSLVHILEAV